MSLETGRINTDVLVLGGGLAAYRAALAARASGVRVTMVSRARGASPYVIGFNSPLGSIDPRDNPEIYFDDVVRAGYGLNDRRLVHVLADRAISSYEELARRGVPFAHTPDGRIAQRHLSGNTYPRSVYVPEGTGTSIVKTLHKHACDEGIQIVSGMTVIDLLRDGEAVVGVLLCKPHTYELTVIGARSVVMAMGGIGRLYANSTYPADVNADALSLALEAGASLIDMEFVQFEPLVVVWPIGCRGMEMPTAMLGDGARMRNRLGERFMMAYNPPHAEKQIEKAKMSLFIQREIDAGRGFPGGGVEFDATMLSPEQLESYVSHCKRLRASGVDPATTAPLVAPAAHSMMGGVAVDEWCWSGIPGLYVGGEAAGGVHGASRIAGNGCSDTLVFGAVAGEGAVQGMHVDKARDWNAIAARAAAELKAMTGVTPITQETIGDAKESIRQTLACAAGIWRSGSALQAGRDALLSMAEELSQARAADLRGAIALREARRMASIAHIIVESSLSRTESRGAHQRTDFPSTDDAQWRRHVSFRVGPDGTPLQEFTPIR